MVMQTSAHINKTVVVHPRVFKLHCTGEFCLAAFPPMIAVHPHLFPVQEASKPIHIQAFRDTLIWVFLGGESPEEPTQLHEQIICSIQVLKELDHIWVTANLESNKQQLKLDMFIVPAERKSNP